MNTTTSITTLLTAALLAGTQAVRAQEAPPQPPEPVVQAQRQVEAAQNRVQEVQDKAERSRRKAEATTLRGASGGIHFAHDGELPEPPPTPRFETAGFDWVGDARVFDGLKESLTVFGGPARANAPIVLATSALDAETRAGLQEDLVVMSRILSKSVEPGRENPERVMGITVNALANARRPQAMYLEGYGAVFLMNVPIALVPPVTKEEEKAPKPVDNEWERTKRELYGPNTVTLNKNIDFLGATKPVKYDAEKVESLKEDLLESLKYAANLRHVKAGEHVSIVLTGGQGSPAHAVARAGGKSSSRSKGEDAKTDKDERKDDGKPVAVARVSTRVTADKTAARETTMTIRVKKADAEAFAKGTLSLEEFTKKAAIAAY